MKFVELMDRDPDLEPAERQLRAAERFPQLVESSPLSIWSPGDPVPQQGLRILLGVAPAWNRYDLALLDVIEEKLTAEPCEDLIVQVFDTDQCQSPEDIRRFIPTLDSPTAWPFLGIWQGGQQMESLWGDAARRRLLELLGIPEGVYDRLLEQRQGSSQRLFDPEGLWTDQGTDISSEDIAEARRETWSRFSNRDD